ncbi:uncharacterized protein [Paramisgurnus dabryanus]|uniref:uncharacterized protein isoform X1 n=1 Tax=Paramisgurnus dabryanus TaxID=90735 RepID=UPI0031F409E2
MFYTSLVLCWWTLVGVFGAEVTLVSVMEGDNVTLHTHFTEIQRENEIKWWFFKDIIIRIKKAANINPEYDKVPPRFRGRVKMNAQNGDLTITDITPQDSGCYKVENITKTNSAFKTFNITVYAASTVSIVSSTVRITVPPKNPSGRQQPDPMILIYCVAAAVGCLMILASVLIFWIYRKHKNKHQQDQSGEDEDTYANTTFHKLNTQMKQSEITEVVYTFYTINTDQNPLLS